MKTRLFNVRLPIELFNLLSENKRVKGISKTFQATEAIKNYLKQN